MVLDLKKGMVLDLTKNNGLKSVDIGVNWGQIKVPGFMGFGGSSKSVDLDLSVFLMSGNVIKKTVYYRNFDEKGVHHSGDDRSGDSVKDDKDNETVSIKFDELTPDIDRIVAVLVSFSGIPFDDIPYAEAKVYNTTAKKEQLSATNLDLDSTYNGKKSMIFGAFEKNGNEWEYRSICEATPHNSIDSVAANLNNYIKKA